MSGFNIPEHLAFLRPYLMPKGRSFSRYTWPGGYPLVYVTGDGETLCAGCLRSEWKQIRAAEPTGRSGWEIVGVDTHYEGEAEHCAHCGAEIPSAYGEPETA